MKLLSVLGVSLALQEATTAPAGASVPAAKASRPQTANTTKPQPKAGPGKSKGDPVARTQPQVLKRDPVTQPAIKRTLVARPKKGSW